MRRVGSVQFLDDEGRPAGTGSIEVYNVDGETCENCGNKVLTLASTRNLDGVAVTSCLECVMVDDYVGRITLKEAKA